MIVATISRAPRPARAIRGPSAEIIVHPSAPQTITGKLLDAHPVTVPELDADLQAAQNAALSAVIEITTYQPRDQALAKLQGLRALLGA